MAFTADQQPWPKRTPGAARKRDTSNASDPIKIIKEFLQGGGPSTYGTSMPSGGGYSIKASLDEPWADTTTLAGKMMMAVFGGIAEFEWFLVLTRTQEGQETAQARQVAFGRPSKLRDDQKEIARDFVNSCQKISAVKRTFNVNPDTIYRYRNEKQPL
ncbi:hypothetical protein [Leisingera daeponensis]|uniref:hypothetical protein n=1 Tax=Leisingera daeponensis TaxID=405746 RepID=UPI001C938CF9|nr:hypothetical protein [Leisingera daeponensis]MBY6059430.1 hypothetical protein [Leisingera daeponensis]